MITEARRGPRAHTDGPSTARRQAPRKPTPPPVHRPGCPDIRHLPDLLAMGDRIFEPRWAICAHRTHACELLHVTAGKVRTLVRGRAGVETGPGGVVLIPPGLRHRDAFDPREGLQVFMISFHWSDAEAYFFRLPRPFVPSPDAAGRRGLESHIARLRALLHSGTESDRMLARAVLVHLLLELRHAHGLRRAPATPGPARRRKALLQQARRFMEAHFTEELSLEHIARSLGISPFYLSHLFSQESDFSLPEYLTTLRMQQAKRLLQTGKHSIKETAHAVGFKDGSYFTKVFRRYFGFTPRDLRDVWRP